MINRCPTKEYHIVQKPRRLVSHVGKERCVNGILVKYILQKQENIIVAGQTKWVYKREEEAAASRLEVFSSTALYLSSDLCKDNYV